MTHAIYNEIEPYAAAWLVNLEQAGHIAPGRVDDRDIRVIQPEDVAGAAQFHAFAGVGVWSHALRLADWPDDVPVWTGSCPCQPFSVAGKRRGTADARHLWPEWFRLIRECLPPVIFGEQVASPDGRNWLDAVSADLEALGYAVASADLCAAGVGAPHIRQRLYFVAIAGGERRERLSVQLRPWGQHSQESEAARRRSLNSVAYADGQRRNSRPTASGAPQRSGSGIADGLEVGSLANADSERLTGFGGGEQDRPPRSSESGASQCGAIGCMEHPTGNGLNQGGSSAQRPPGQGGARPADVGLVGDAGRERSGRHAGAVPRPEGESEGEGGAARHLPDELVPSGPTRGFWADADWLPCRDGKARPVEPGSFPLAHGATARVGRLRAFGNAIVPQVAAEFIGAAMETLT